MNSGSTFTVTVIPCGREDMSQCGPEELPYELTLQRFPGSNPASQDGASFNIVGSEQTCGGASSASDQFQFQQQRKHTVSSTGHKLSEIFMADEGIW